jgi:hypothetical protein
MVINIVIVHPMVNPLSTLDLGRIRKLYQGENAGVAQRH